VVRPAILPGIISLLGAFVAPSFGQEVGSKMTIKHTGPVFSVLFLPGGKSVASTSWRAAGTKGLIYYVRFTDVGSGEEWLGFDGPTRALAVSPSGRLLASLTPEGEVAVWYLGSGKRRVSPLEKAELVAQGQISDPPAGVAFTPDGKALVGWARGAYKVWDLATGQLRDGIDCNRSVSYTASPDGKLLPLSAEQASGREVYLVDLTKEFRKQSGGPLVAPEKAAQAYTSPTRGITVACAISDDSKRLASAFLVSEDNRSSHVADKFLGTEVNLWDLQSRKFLAASYRIMSKKVSVLCFSPGGRLLVAGCADGTVRIHDPTTGREVATLAEHKGRVHALAFSADGTALATASEDGTVKLWDVVPIQKQKPAK
jgi:WD40 repeat protein